MTEQPIAATGALDSALSTTVTGDALGESLTSIEHDGMMHTYAYDVLGQQTARLVEALVT